MATSTYNNQTHIYADNPVIQPKTEFADTFQPIKHDGRWLRNRYTGEIVPNNEMYVERSDILEPISDEEADKIFGRTAPAKPKTAAKATKGMDEL